MASGVEPPITTDNVDLLETNSYYDSDGKLVFVQRIYWDWSGEAFEVRDWRMVKECNYPHGKSITWNDSGILRRVTANSVRVSHTQHDPELEDRKELGKEQRRELSRPLSRQRAKELLQRTKE